MKVFVVESRPVPSWEELSDRVLGAYLSREAAMEFIVEDALVQDGSAATINDVTVDNDGWIQVRDSDQPGGSGLEFFIHELDVNGWPLGAGREP